MLEKGQNIFRNNQLGRIVKYNNEWEQITIENTRFYKHKEEFYPSVTYILSYYPKGDSFAKWLKANGEDADIIAQEAAIKGTNVHKAIEYILEGKELKWIDEDGYVNYSLEEWTMISKFVDFWKTYKPKLIESETHIYSHIHKLAGTIDLIVELNGETWVIDIKTSNSLHTIYELQTAVYQECWNEHNELKVTRTGILWLNAKTRKPSNDPTKIQGRGWSLVTSDRSQEENFKIFQNVYSIFKLENPELKPISEKYPNSLSLNEEE